MIKLLINLNNKIANFANENPLIFALIVITTSVVIAAIL